MRRILGWACILALGALCWGAQSAAPAKKKSKSSTKKAAASKSGAAKKGSTAKRGKKGVTWRNRQTAPAPERYKQIQDALAAKGYFKAEDANGVWGPASADALKKFQADQNIEATGKVNSLSLIALGLGPRRDATPVPKAPDPPPPEK